MSTTTDNMPSSERIVKLSAALDLDIAKLGAGAANGFAVGDEVMLPGELRALLKAAQQPTVDVPYEASFAMRVVRRADGKLVSQHRALPLGEWQDTGTMTDALNRASALAQRLAVAEGLLREAAKGVPVGWTCYRRTKAVDDPTDVEDMLVPLLAGEPGSCGECLPCRIAALLAPAPATPATVDEVSKGDYIKGVDDRDRRFYPGETT